MRRHDERPGTIGFVRKNVGTSFAAIGLLGQMSLCGICVARQTLLEIKPNKIAARPSPTMTNSNYDCRGWRLRHPVRLGVLRGVVDAAPYDGL